MAVKGIPGGDSRLLFNWARGTNEDRQAKMSKENKKQTQAKGFVVTNQIIVSYVRLLLY